MYPVIRPQDKCSFEPVEEQTLRIGDILLAVDREGSLVGHRLIRIDGDLPHRVYLCKGDTNRYPDAPITFNQVIGRLRSIERQANTPTAAARISFPPTGLRALWAALVRMLPLLSIGLRRWLVLSRRIS